MRVLVVGGAGYIGSVVSHLLLSRGYEVTVLDNLSMGHREAVSPDAHFIQGDISEQPFLGDIFRDNTYSAVMHFCAKAFVGESVTDPIGYYLNNVSYTTHLLDAAIRAGIERFIFSSSAAVFGIPQSVPIDEEHPQKPINPYGHTKAMVEQILNDVASATKMRHVSLRYFNAAGAAVDADLGEDHHPETHLIPRAIGVALNTIEGPLEIFGTDYPTQDGTCIRDYIHVTDLAEAHVLALEYLAAGGDSACFNLGNGNGYSVREVVRAVEDVLGKAPSVNEAPRRPGDPPVLVASSKKIQRVLGWHPIYPALQQIIETACHWHEKHPMGYGDTGSS